MRRSATILLAATIAAVPMTGAAQAARPESLASARAAVEAHYAAYRLDADAANVPRTVLAMGPQLRAALRRASPPDGLLSADPLCDCQDYDEAAFRADIRSVQAAGRQVRVRVDVAPVKDAAPTRLTLLLDRHRGAWVITDVIGPFGDSLLAGARAAAPGSWGQ
jgi:hypothetical protein